MKPSEIGDSVVFISSAPDHLVSPWLLFWLLNIGARQERITFTRRGRDVCLGLNHAVSVAKNTDAPFFVFCDRDVRPSPKGMLPWVEASGDVVCAKYSVETGESAWIGDKPPFHTGIFRLSKGCVDAIKLPLFGWNINEDGTDISGCNCQFARDRLLDAGFSPIVAGECGHTPRQKDGLPDILHFGDA